MAVQVSHVILYVLSFLTANLEFAYKKSNIDWKIVILTIFVNVNKKSKFADKKSANSKDLLYSKSCVLGPLLGP